LLCPLNRRAISDSVSRAGERPEALRACSPPPAQAIANPSPPIPLLVGSTTVSAIAVATAASKALPPFLSISSPAWAARGWLVATQLRA
jgi:hypothetical protein